MLTPGGSFYTAFSETNLPTGDYSAHLEDAKKKPYGNVSFRIDAYRIPTFEVELHAPRAKHLDTSEDRCCRTEGDPRARRDRERRVVPFDRLDRAPRRHGRRSGDRPRAGHRTGGCRGHRRRR